MAQNQNKIEIDETLVRTGDDVVEARYKYKGVPVDGGTRDNPSVSVKKSAYDPLALTIKNKKLPFKDFVRVLRVLMTVDKSEKGIAEAFGLLDESSNNKIDIKQLSDVLAIIVPNVTEAMLLDNIQKLGYKRDKKLGLTEFGKLFGNEGVGRDTVLQCLQN